MKLIKVILFSLGFMGASVARALSQDVLTIGMSAEFENLNPLISSTAATKYMLYLAWRPLVILTPDNEWKPLLIKQIPTIENKLAKKKGNGLEVTIEIIEKAQWGDGTPLTCKDIELAWQIGKSKNVSNPNREPYENITSIVADKSNPKKCTLVMAKTKYDFYMTMPDPLPAHLEGPVFKKFGDKPEGYDLNSLYTKNPTNPGLYFGPYVISEVKLGSHLIFTPNPHFYGKAPAFKKIVFKIVPNNATLEANLRSGIIDMISSTAGLGLDQAVIFERKVKAENLAYQVVFEDGVVYAHIDFNLDNPILSDLKVRKALLMSFNKKEMIQSLLEGRGRPANHFVTEKDPWFTNKVENYSYNKREAARLLEEAGWKMGPKGYREKGGKTLSLNLLAAAGAKLNEMIEVYLQEKFKAVGVELLVKNEPPRVFFGETVSHRKFDLAMYSWISIPESSPRSSLHSSMIPSASNSWAGQNYPGYKNPEVDHLIEKLEEELNPQQRAAYAKKIVEAYVKDIPVIPVYYRPTNCVIPKGLKGFRLSGHTFYETLTAENWSL